MKNNGNDTEASQNKHRQKTKMRKNKERKKGKPWAEDEH